MRVQAESTEKIVQLRIGAVDVPARVWEATTEAGVECLLFVTRVAVRNDRDSSQFERELTEQNPPSAEVQSWPLRMIL